MTLEPTIIATAAETDAERLLAWYDGHRRALPWRAAPGQQADPYAVWLSEVMLQQTTVAVVKGHFAAFLLRWPRVTDLAAAPIGDVMARWAGLGYYSRARNLHACARQVAATGGVFPDTEEGLLALPGIGPYTAAAIAAIAFQRRAVVVDGNVERVITRLHAIETPIRDSKALIRTFATARTPERRCGDYAQAMMDLGATICTPRRPACVICPIGGNCDARRTGRQAALPLRTAKPQTPVRFGSVFFVRRGLEVLVRTRDTRGLFGGMTEFPGSAWDAVGDPEGLAKPFPAPFRKSLSLVEHGLTHFTLVLTVFAARVEAGSAPPDDCRWVPEADLAREALPTLMRKVAVAAQDLLQPMDALA